MKDVGVLLKMLWYFPNVFLPFGTAQSSDELHMDLKGARNMVLQFLVFILEFVILLLAVPVVLFLPGIGIAAVGLVTLISIHALTLPLQGGDIYHSKLDAMDENVADMHQDERWVFVNGCATDYDGLRKNVDLLSKTFCREVTGVHNKSFGLIGDLLECLIQRCFSYKTRAVRVAYTSIKPLLTDPEVSKVVLLGHSQGGIIISLALDQLFTELPHTDMAKLEVYTFGSAASHFSNPLLPLDSSEPPSPSLRVRFDGPTSPVNSKHVIPHIEHYANELDMIPRWGVLHNAKDIQNDRYAGSVFVRLGCSGHFFNQHYLSQMFPLAELEQSVEPDESFLDRTVSTGADWVASKASETLAGVITALRNNSGLELGSGQTLHAMNSNSSLNSGSSSTPASSMSMSLSLTKRPKAAAMVFSRTDSGYIVGEKASGKTVRELSRLWRYQGGGVPEMERGTKVFEPQPEPQPAETVTAMIVRTPTTAGTNRQTTTYNNKSKKVAGNVVAAGSPGTGTGNGTVVPKEDGKENVELGSPSTWLNRKKKRGGGGGD